MPLGLNECFLPASPITSQVSVDADGVGWLSSVNYVYYLPVNQTLWQPISAPTLDWGMQWHVPAANGGIWATHGQDLFHLTSGVTTTSNVPLDSTCRFTTRPVADSRNVWGATENCNLLQYNLVTAQWTSHSMSHGSISQLALSSDGVLYAVGPAGLYEVTDPEWHPIIQEEAILAADKTGGIWIASLRQNQLWHYIAGQLTPYDQPFNTLAQPRLTVDSRNRLWVALANNDVLWFYDGKSWQHVQSFLSINDLTSGPDGRIWISGHQGIAVYDPSKDQQP
jgi:hypothetical protein